MKEVEKKEKDYEELKKNLSDASLDYLFECQNDYGYENQTEKQDDIDGKEENIMKTEMEKKRTNEHDVAHEKEKGKEFVYDVATDKGDDINHVLLKFRQVQDILVGNNQEIFGKRKRSTRKNIKTPSTIIQKIKTKQRKPTSKGKRLKENKEKAQKKVE